jgi:N-acetyl-alpha-D-muramate 1-phosphate uridylyltransferase
MQAVILAGGLATRLRPVTLSVPKSLISIEGKPFLEYQLELLKRHHIQDIVLCVGYLKDPIKDHFGNGSQFGVDIIYSEEDYPLGTAGALKHAEQFLDDQFFLLYGDSYLMIDYKAVMRKFSQCGALGLMVVYKNDNLFDTSNVIISDGMVSVYDKSNSLPGMIYIDYGLSALQKKALDIIPDNTFSKLDILFQHLIKNHQLAAFEADQRFYEIGSHTGLDEFTKLISSGSSFR